MVSGSSLSGDIYYYVCQVHSLFKKMKKKKKGFDLPITPNSSNRALTLNNKQGHKEEGEECWVRVPMGTDTILNASA